MGTSTSSLGTFLAPTSSLSTRVVAHLRRAILKGARLTHGPLHLQTWTDAATLKYLLLTTFNRINASHLSTAQKQALHAHPLVEAACDALLLVRAASPTTLICARSVLQTLNSPAAVVSVHPALRALSGLSVQPSALHAHLVEPSSMGGDRAAQCVLLEAIRQSMAAWSAFNAHPARSPRLKGQASAILAHQV